MPSSFRFALAAALAMACHGALAQTQTAVPPTLTVQRLAPQLVAFAGSQSNFQSLVTGLAQGTPVQLVSLLPDGFTQVVTFTPAGAMSPTDIARVLESARQQLIGLGIANPTAEQIGFTLMGGTVPTALGGTQVAGVLNAQNPPSPAAQAQSRAAAGATASPTNPVTTPAVTSAVNVQLFPSAVPAGTSATPTARSTSDSLSPAGAISRSPATGNTSDTSAPATPVTPGADAAATSAPKRTPPETTGPAAVGKARN
jgi:hypothetical protein